MIGDAGIDKSKLLKLLGLARRAGRVACGFKAVAQLVARGRRPLVIVAVDASPGQRDRILRMQPVREFWTDCLTRDELAPALGRKELIVVALDDQAFLRGLGVGKSGKRSRPTRKVGRRTSSEK